MISEPITKALTLAGHTLEFSGFDIKGVVGFNLSILLRGEQTLYEIEKQNFSFQVSSIDVFDNEIVEGMEFTMEDSNSIYTFSVERPPIDDLTGWAELHVNYISRIAS